MVRPVGESGSTGEGTTANCRTIFVVNDWRAQFADDSVQNSHGRWVQVGGWGRIVENLLDTCRTKGRGIVCAIVRIVANWELEAQVADASEDC